MADRSIDTAAAQSAAQQLYGTLTAALDQLAARTDVTAARANLTFAFGKDQLEPVTVGQADFKSWAAMATDIAAQAKQQGIDVVRQVQTQLDAMRDALGLTPDNSWVKYAVVILLAAAGIGTAVYFVRKDKRVAAMLPPWRQGRVTVTRPRTMRRRRRAHGVYEREDDLDGYEG